VLESSNQLFSSVVDKEKNPPTQESYSSKNFDYTSGLEQQTSIIEKRIKVNNNWGIDNKENHENGDNTGNSSKEMPLRSMRLAMIAIMGKGKQSRGAPLSIEFN
jgi:hypothetical protein